MSARWCWRRPAWSTTSSACPTDRRAATCPHAREAPVPTEPERHAAVTQHECMRLAIAKAREGIAAGQAPFGALIVCGDAVVAVAHNTVWRDRDPTAHAEVNAIRHGAALL